MNGCTELAPPLCEARAATTRRDLVAAFRLLHDAYVAEGLALPHLSQIRITPHQLIESSQVYVAVRQRQVAATLTLVPDSLCGLPMEEIFSQEVDRRRRWARVAEVSCLAERSNSNRLSLLVQLKSLMAQSAVHRGIEELLIVVHPRHVRYYTDFVGFQVIGPPRRCPTVRDHLAVPLALDLTRLHVHNPRAYARFFGKKFPAEALARRPLSREIVSEFVDIAGMFEPGLPVAA